MKARRQQMRIYFWSAIAALVMTVAFYAVSNSTVPISKESTYLKFLGRTRNFIVDEKIPADFLFINISYDRDLVEVTDDFGFPKGNLDITDRSHLAQFLRIANLRSDYKYIFLDIRFEDRLKSPHDSLLYELIATTPRLVVPVHEGIELSDERISRKAGWADYHGTLSEGDFVKYVVGDEDRPSIVLKAYEDIRGQRPHTWWKFSVCDGHLMRTSMIPLFEFNITGPFSADGERQFYNLGSDLLTDPEGLELLLSEKYVFVGDYEDVDLHQTYLGSMPGSAIHANMLINLLNDKHLVGYGTLVFMFLVFFVLNVAMASNHTVSVLKEPGWMKRRAASSTRWHTAMVWWGWLYSFLGYGFIFSALFLVLLATVGAVYEVLVLSVIFLVLSRIANYLKKHKKI